MSSTLSPEMIVPCDCALGESPTWHAGSNALYWSDIARGELHRFRPDSGEHRVVLTGTLVSGISVERDGALLLLGRWGAIGRFADSEIRWLRRWNPRHFGYRFNDCIADPQGRLFAGIMGYELDMGRVPMLPGVRRRLQRARLLRRASSREGKLCLLSRERGIRVVGRGLGRPNGMGFCPDLGTLYVTDSAKRQILGYPYDAETGSLGPPRIAVRVTAAGVPDGLAVDASGCLWSAQHRGGAVIRYAADGRELDRVTIPTRRVTSLTFAGPDNRDLYLTSARSATLSMVARWKPFSKKASRAARTMDCRRSSFSRSRRALVVKLAPFILTLSH